MHNQYLHDHKQERKTHSGPQLILEGDIDLVTRAVGDDCSHRGCVHSVGFQARHNVTIVAQDSDIVRWNSSSINGNSVGNSVSRASCLRESVPLQHNTGQVVWQENRANIHGMG